MKELLIVVRRREDLRGHEFTAYLQDREKYTGHGHTVEAAVTDLFTCRGAQAATEKLEKLAAPRAEER